MEFLQHRHSFGVALIFAGMPIIWIFRDIVGASEKGNQIYSIVFMVLGLCFITFYRNLPVSALDSLFPFLKKKHISLLFIIPSLIASTGKIPFDPIDAGYLLFCVFFLIAINTVPYEKFYSLPQTFLTVSGSGCILLICYTLSSGIDLSGQRLIAGTTNSPGQVSFMGAVAVVSGLFTAKYFSRHSSAIFRTYIYVSILAGIAVIILSISRATIISLALSLLFFLISYSSLSSEESILQTNKLHSRFNFALINLRNKFFRFRKTEILLAAVSIVTIVFYGKVVSPVFNLLGKYLDKFSQYFQRGFDTYQGNGGKEMSAATRKFLLDKAITDMNSWGHGYKSLWVDFPIVQSFYDGGLLTGGVFSALTLVMPLAMIFRFVFNKREHDTIRLFCIYNYILLLPNLFLNGQPYDFYIWLRVILFYSLML